VCNRSDISLYNRAQDLRVVFIFGADIEQAENPDHLGGLGWQSSRKDKTGPCQSYERVQAAAVLWQMNNSLILVPSGGRTTVEGVGDSPAISTVMSAELVALGVPEDNIVEEPLGENTWGQVVHCATMMRDHSWFLDSVAILAPFWQFPRILAMIARGNMSSVLPFGGTGTKETMLLSMERVLAADDLAWDSRFKQMYATSEMQAMFASEAQGAGQILAGHSPRFPNSYPGFDDPLTWYGD
jgi:hypothetical protein